MEKTGLYNIMRWKINNNDYVAIIIVRGVCNGDGSEDELVFYWQSGQIDGQFDCKCNS